MVKTSLFDLVPVFFCGLLDLVVAEIIVVRAPERVGQILLPHPMIRVAVRIFIALLALKARAVGVNILQLARRWTAFAGADIGDGSVDRP